MLKGVYVVHKEIRRRFK